MDSVSENIGIGVSLGGEPYKKPHIEPLKRIESALLGHANARWEEAKQSHNLIEERLLDAIRRRKGEYSDSKLSDIKKQGGSSVYMQLTGIKCSAASSWIQNVLFQPGERIFSIDPTPVPDQEKMIDTVVQAIMAEAQQQGMQADESAVRSEIEKRNTEDLDKRTENMANKIADQLAEGGFESALEQVVDDITVYQAGFLKGPIVRQKIQNKWVQGQDGWQLERSPEFVLEWERVSPFDMFPAPDAVNIDESWLIERHRFSRKSLQQFKEVPGYDREAIDAVLDEFAFAGRDEYVSGDQTRERLETTTSNQAYRTETISGYELWDSISGKMLLNWDNGRGLLNGDDVDPHGEYEVNLIIIGSHIIKVDIADDISLRRPYYMSSYDKVPGSFWGRSIPEIMRDVQDVCNGCARALVNNMSIASGPQIGINVDKMPAGEAVTSMHPWKYHQFTGDMAGAITFFNPPSHAEELMRIYEYFSSKADEYTGIPAFAYGQSDAKGAGATASGLSMLMSSASNGIKSVVANIDRNIIEPAVKRLYDFNMMHSDDESIKGDAKIVSMGARSLMVKEQMQNKRMEFMAQTLNPVDLQILGSKGRAELLRESAKALDLPASLIPTDEEIAADQKAQMQGQQEQQWPMPAQAPQ